MWQKLKHFFHYYTIKEDRSPINGLYKVVMLFNRPRLVIGNMIQSGGAVRKIWHKAINHLKTNKVKITKALIIGLGCGDAAFEIQKHYRQAKIVGVEIDPHVIDMARCYFDLATVKNLSISIADGAKYVAKIAKRKPAQKFSLILIDAYLGNTMPKSFRSKTFFKQLTGLLTPDGVVIYNHLFYDQYKQEAAKFIKELETQFDKVTLVRTGQNLLIFGWN
ncbi:MAG: fused MFS/spermidine synthase [Patescibacteria group bacterium]|nr:fused MFS/spermidine synthase [Candidatus Beckwithbacteria bacterium]MDZ4229177.1 fused MFS/spermidine synthase [Patescibacteria group bacterium]